MDEQTYINEHTDDLLAELIDFLRIPSISSLSEHREDVRRAANWVAEKLQGICGPTVEVIDDPDGGHPLVYGECMTSSEQPTLLIYGHYDVQPPDPLGEWRTSPFEPARLGDDLYARGAADDKGQIFALIAGVEAVLQSRGHLPINVKFLIEGEEEVSGLHIKSYVRQHVEQIKADACLIADTSMLAPGQPTLCTGLRGLAYMEVRVQGAQHDLHSGEYGGAAPNAANGLVHIVSRLKDDRTGKVLIPHFYDDVIDVSPAERQAWGRLPFDEAAFLKEEVGASQLTGELEYSVLERLWARPTLDINGIHGGFTGEGSKTVIPAHCMAKVSMRLVPNQDPERVAQLFKKAVQEACPRGVTVDVITHGLAAPVLVPSDTQTVHAASSALQTIFGTPAFVTRLGGSIPVVSVFMEAGIPSVMAGFGLPDDNLHAPNEKMHIPNIFAGMRFTAQLLHNLAQI